MNERMAAYLSQTYAGANGLRELLELAQSYTEQIPRKLRHMQEVYLARNPSLYSAEQTATLAYYLDAILYKEFSCDWLTEQIQGIRHTGSGDRRLLAVLENSLDAQNTQDVDTVIWSLLLDNFMVQAAGFLDFSLLYVWTFFGNNSPSNKYLKWNTDIRPMLEAVKEPSQSGKARSVADYVGDWVFATSPAVETMSVRGWGTVVSGLRHAVVHRDRSGSLPSFEEAKTLTEKRTSEWDEALRTVYCAQFCEDVRGDMFGLMQKLAEVLWEQPWVPGPFRG